MQGKNKLAIINCYLTYFFTIKTFTPNNANYKYTTQMGGSIIELKRQKLTNS